MLETAPDMEQNFKFEEELVTNVKDQFISTVSTVLEF